MFLPTGDTPNPRNFTPWVNWFLIGINIAIYLFIALPLSLTPVDPSNPLVIEYLRSIRHSIPPHVHPMRIVESLNQYDLFLFVHGFKSGAAQWTDLLFSMFLHGGFAHLAGNMLFLWIFGDNVEHRLGRLRYLSSYLATGIAASVFFSFFSSNSFVPMVGASGAISGVLGLYFVLFPRNQVKVFIFLFPFLMDVYLLPARWVLGIYLIIDNLLPFFIGAQSSVAYGAHIGGFLAGWGIAFVGENVVWRLPGRMRVVKERYPEDVEASEPDLLPAALARAIRNGQSRQALRLAAETDMRLLTTLESQDCLQLATWLAESGNETAAARLLRGCLTSHQGPDLAEIYLQLGLLRLQQGQHAAAYQHLLDAIDHTDDPFVISRTRHALDQLHLYRRR